MYNADLNVYHDIIIHLCGHVEHVVVRVVVHDGVGEHPHHVPLELSRGADGSHVHLSLDGRQVHGSGEEGNEYTTM